MIFRTVPVTVEAEQFKVGKPAPLSVCFCDLYKGKPHMHTKRGSRQISHGDWIARNSRGQVFTVADKKFKNDYERAE